MNNRGMYGWIVFSRQPWYRMSVFLLSSFFLIYMEDWNIIHPFHGWVRSYTIMPLSATKLKLGTAWQARLLPLLSTTEKKQFYNWTWTLSGAGSSVELVSNQTTQSLGLHILFEMSFGLAWHAIISFPTGLVFSYGRCREERDVNWKVGPDGFKGPFQIRDSLILWFNFDDSISWFWPSLDEIMETFCLPSALKYMSTCLHPNPWHQSMIKYSSACDILPSPKGSDPQIWVTITSIRN